MLEEDTRRSGEKKRSAPSQISLVRRTARSVIWLLGQSLAARLISLLSQLVLARILLPADFGVIGLAMALANIASGLVGFGIDQVLQQRRRAARLWTTQIFAISLGLALVSAGIMAVLAPLGSVLYGDARIAPLLLILAVSTPLSVIGTVPQAALQNALRFKFLATYNTMEAVSIQAMTIALALAGAGAFSFVLPGLVTGPVRAIVYWRESRLMLRPISRSRGWRLIFWRSGWALGARIVTVLVGQGDFFVLGIYAGMSEVGAYYFAFRLASQPMTMLASNVQNALFSALNNQPDPSERARATLTAAELLALLTFPACFMVAAIARPALLLLFGQKWSASIPLVQILSLGLPFDAISWVAGALLSARGKFRLSFFCQLYTTPLFFLLVWLGAVIASARGVAVGVSIYYVIHPMIFSVVTFYQDAAQVKRVLLAFFQPFWCGAIAFGLPFLASGVLEPTPVIQLMATGISGSIVYVILIRLFLRSQFDEVVKMIRHIMA